MQICAHTITRLGIGKLASLFVLLLVSDSVSSHPAKSAHSHNSSSIAFEHNDNGADDGSAYHNHMFPISFGGITQTSREPYTAFGCWDNGSWRGEYLDLFFDRGHCFINNITDIQSVTYSFEGSWSSNAKDVIRYAFGRFNAISTFATTIVPHGVTGNQIGIEFSEVATGGIIQVYFVNQLSGLGAGGVGIFLPADWPGNPRGAHYIEIASNPYGGFPGWDYSLTPATEDVSKWHLLTVALHEIGHAVGLHHQSDADDLMYANQNSPVGAPDSFGPRKIHYDVDFDSETGVYHLYGQTPTTVPPPPTCEVIFFGCDESNNEMVFVSFDDPLGYSANNFVVQKQLAGGVWSAIGGLTAPGCVSNATSLGNNLYRVLLHLGAGISECQVTYFSDGEYCRRNGEDF